MLAKKRRYGFFLTLNNPLEDRCILEEIEKDIFIVSEQDAEQRLDKVLARRFKEEKSRTYFQYLIDQKKVLVNGNAVKKRMLLQIGDRVEISFISPPQLSLQGENIPLDIIYEDQYLIVVNKPAGMVVHPAVGNWSGTFVNALLYHCHEVQSLIYNGLEMTIRPGIVHRLDKDTTGLLIAAKTASAHEKLSSLFAKREVYKEYLAITVGNPGNRTIDLPLGRNPKCYKEMMVMPEGKRAISQCTTLAYNEQLALVSIVLITGRTHQIRVHLKSQGAPVLGDNLYGNSRVNQAYQVSNQLLHAYRLRFKHPFTEEILELKAPIPKEMAAFLQTFSCRNI